MFHLTGFFKTLTLAVVIHKTDTSGHIIDNLNTKQYENYFLFKSHR
jgi:hypothetical protein